MKTAKSAKSNTEYCYIDWNQTVLKTMKLFVEQFMKSFKRTMVPTKYHYIAAFLNPLTSTLTKRSDYMHTWSPECADREEIEKEIKMHMAKVFHNCMTDTEKEAIYADSKSPDIRSPDQVKTARTTRTDEYGNLVLSSGGHENEANDPESDAERDWVAICEHQVDKEMTSFKAAIVPLLLKVTMPDGMKKVLFDDSAVSDIEKLCMGLTK